MQPAVTTAEFALLIQDVPLLEDATLRPDARERLILRRLAEQVAALAVQPIGREKQALWRAQNRLAPTRSIIFCVPENSWHKIIHDESLQYSYDFTHEKLREVCHEGMSAARCRLTDALAVH